jgi:ankyrin repeat protein
LRNRPAQHNRQAEEDTASGSGLKRGRPSEAEEEGMDTESSSEPHLKRRRGEGEAATPERLQAPVGNIDPRDGLIREAQEVLDAVTATSSGPRMTPLCYAASRGFESSVRHLVDVANYLDVNIAFAHAIKSGHLNIVELLHARGANLGIKDASGKGCLYYAANDGREEVVRWLLSKNVPVDEPTEYGITPLMMACFNRHLKVAQMLHRKGASLTAKDNDGDMCLHFAVNDGREEVVSWLLDEKVPLDEPNNSGVTPLTLACGRGHLKVAQILHGSGASLTHKASGGLNCLHSAAIRGRKEVVSWLLSQGLGIDEPSDAGTTPLMFALKFAQKKGDFAATRLLIERSANLYLPVDNEELIGDAIFRIACDQERYDVLVSLIERDSDFSAYLDTLPSEGSSETVDPMKIRARSAAVHDLNRVFQGMEIQADLALEDQVDQLLDPAWLSPEKKSDRQEFIDNYQNLFFLTDSNTSNQSISKSVFSSHPMFSYTIHNHLKAQQGEFSNLLQALVGTGKPINTSHKKKILWFKLEALKAAQITQPFQNKNLLPVTENIICNVITRQLDALRLAAQEYFLDEQASFSEVFKKLCEKYIRIGGNFDDAGFNKALAKLGIYAINADRMTTVIKQAWEIVRSEKFDLPPMPTIGLALDLSGSQVIERLFAEIKKLVIQVPEVLSLPGFADGLKMLEQHDQDIYADQIFGQWRQLNAALGVVLPGPFAALQ